MGSEDAVETVAHAFTAFNRRDLPGLLAYCHPDIEWVPMRETMDGRTYRGADGVREAMADVDYEFEELQNDPRRFTAFGERVLVTGRFVAKERRSGLRIDNPAAWLVELRDGLVTLVRAFPSEDAALEALRERE